MRTSLVRREYQRKYRREHKDEIRKYQKDYVPKWRQNGGNKNVSECVNRYKKSQRCKIIKILGEVCSSTACMVPGGCKDIRCLEIDHINGGGHNERKRFQGSGTTWYNFYLENTHLIKSHLQVLCANCHRIKTHLR